MNKTRSLLVTMMSAAAVALAEPPAGQTPDAPPPPPPGPGVEGARPGAPGGTAELRDRARRFMTGEGEGMLLRMLTSDSRLVQELGLSDTQVKDIKDGMSASEAEMKELNTKLEQAALRQTELLKAETLDEEALMKAVDETGELRTQIAKIRIKQVIAAHKALTSEQRAKLRESMKQRMEQMQARFRDGAGREGLRGGGDREGRGHQPGAGPGRERQGDRGEAQGQTAPRTPAPPAAQ